MKASTKLNDTDELEYVGFWPRVWASLIDTVLVLALTAPILMAVYGREYFFLDGLQGPGDFAISYVLPAIAVLVFWSTKSATPGKMAIGAKIVDAETGGKPSVSQHIIRYLGYYVSMFPLFLGIIWVGFDRKKQGWHDKMGRTVVVRKKDRRAEAVRFE